MAAPKMTKNQLRRARKKELKKAQAEAKSKEVSENEKEESKEPEPEDKKPVDLEVKKDPATPDVDADGPVIDDFVQPPEDPAFAEYKAIFEKFGVVHIDEDNKNQGPNKGEVFFDQDDEIPSEDEEQQPKLSKKKRKKLNKLSIAELKALVKNPEVVEWHDVSSSDPRLLVQIKAQRNVVPVPGHWSLKREYLSSKRGIEKPPFKLPKFIADTGITEMRDAILEKQEQQTLKQKQRERVQPKMGKLDIDYQKLYDAFFRHQTKPNLTRFGDVYYEGKEWEADYKIFKPGEMSDALKEALGMQPGYPPPWLLAQQRIGPPPSYPTLKIPGLNAPIPPGASWGFQPGQWGKPPLDEYNRPLYGGDIFGIMNQPGYATQPQGPVSEPIDRSLWGELQPPAEESEEESEEEEEEEEGSEVGAGEIPPGGTETSISGFETPAVTHAEAPGLETSLAGEFDLRKARRGFETEESAAPRQAYTVIPERQARVEGFFGSDKVYDLSAASRSGVPVLGSGEDDASRKRKKPGDVDVALDPDQLAAGGGLSKEELKKKYEAGRKEEGIGAQWTRSREYEEDLSEMIAQESRKRLKREEERKGRR